MSDVHLDEEGTELERELLASWKTMTAPEDARKKALGVLAVGATAVVATQAAVAASAGGKAAATKSAGFLAKVFGKIVAKVSAGLNLGTGAAAAAPMATGIVAKTVIAGAVVMTTAVGVEVGVPIVREKLERRASNAVVDSPAVGAEASKTPQHEATPAIPPLLDEAPSTSTPAPEEAVAPAVDEAAPTAALSEAVAPSAAPQARSVDAPKEKPRATPRATEAVEPAPEARAAEAPKIAPKAAPDLTLALRAIESGRKALADRNPTAAIEYLTVIGNDSPLAAEAMALRFDAYTRAGNREAARYVAKKLVTSFPDSPYASRMQRALDEGE